MLFSLPCMLLRPTRPMHAPACSVRLLLPVMLTGAVLAGCSRKHPTSVTAEPATVRTITQTVTATGKIQPEVEVKISAEVAGEILELPFREGATVNKGDLLVRIKSDLYEFLVEQREADLAAAHAAAVQAKARLAKAGEDLERMRGLHAKNLVADSDFTAARTEQEVAQAEYENALAQIRRVEGTVKQAKDELEKTTIYAPMDGTVSSLTSEVGERVVATGQFTGTEVMRVADLANMELRVDVNENDIVNVKVGDPARITIDAYPDEQVRGKVTEIAARATTTGQNSQDEVTRFEVRMRIDARKLEIRPGMSATAEIETQTVTDVVSVPIQSVTVRSRQAQQDRRAIEGRPGKGAPGNPGRGRRHGGQRTPATGARTRRSRLAAAGRLRRARRRREDGPGRNGDRRTPPTWRSNPASPPAMSVVSGNFKTITTTLTDGMKVSVEEPRKGGKK